MLKGLGEAIPVDLNPLAFQVEQPLVGRHEPLPFILCELLVTQGEMDLEIQHRIGAEAALLLVADGHRHAGPGTLAPPVREADQEAALFEQGNLFEKPVGFRGCPRQRVKHIARLDQFPDEIALLRRRVHGGTTARSALFCCAHRRTLAGLC